MWINRVAQLRKCMLTRCEYPQRTLSRTYRILYMIYFELITCPGSRQMYEWTRAKERVNGVGEKCEVGKRMEPSNLNHLEDFYLSKFKRLSIAWSFN